MSKTIPAAGTTTTTTSSEALEIKDARLIFNAVWAGLEDNPGHDQLRFPKEIILLGGAPGAGKGTNTRFIMKARSFTCPPIVVSDLLDTPEARAIKDAGKMVGDREVIGILLRKMLEPEFNDGCVLDGFPRTGVQVECLKLLVEKINALHREFSATSLAGSFRKPVIHAMVLFVEESTSIARQLHRGREVTTHNEKVRRTGEGELLELRATDIDEAAARRRYVVFKEKTWEALQSLREQFFYHFINAEGTVAKVEQNILDELRYQSSLELDPRTFELLRSIPLASEIVIHARQDLVRRLDSYAIEQPELLSHVVAVIEKTFMPIIERHAISGLAIVSSEDTLFSNPLALAMLIDIFSERGFHASIDKRKVETPEYADPATGAISCRTEWVYRIRVHFQGSEIRRG
ncbi:MAG: nucleoside monophosphate kinase [Verrucomicrobiales bacterium]|nr:nucleoside monophosphate kinase [Verrucomicrobiales bacterium]